MRHLPTTRQRHPGIAKCTAARAAGIFCEAVRKERGRLGAAAPLDVYVLVRGRVARGVPRSDLCEGGGRCKVRREKRARRVALDVESGSGRAGRRRGVSQRAGVRYACQGERTRVLLSAGVSSERRESVRYIAACEFRRVGGACSWKAGRCFPNPTEVSQIWDTPDPHRRSWPGISGRIRPM